MKVYENEEGYIQLMKEVIAIENKTPDRTGCGTRKMFGATVDFPDVLKRFPLFTSRPVPFKFCFEEITMFLKGIVQTKYLEEKGVNFWKGNTTREFLDKRKLNHLPEGHMGWAYGAVLRHDGGDYLKTENGEYDPRYIPTGGFDQLAYVINELKTDIWSRRALIELWSPANIYNCALTPCCHGYNFTAEMGSDGKPELNLAITVRSSDTPFGLAANAPQFGYLLVAMAKLVGVRPKKLSMILIDAHVYSGGYANQVPYIKEAVEREMYPLPQLIIHKELNTMEDLLSMTMDDLEFENYEKNTTTMKEKRPPMAV